ncbi:hypothetical protein [Asticcacaulis benevestitus]|uniref:hypothetical protein n=1 Tax=Asticcacaulis benevestitus TaxID=347481 RepID=UPI0004756151|nr:hypothetical protein [Asticcacaulis benevestitus]
MDERVRQVVKKVTADLKADKSAKWATAVLGAVIMGAGLADTSQMSHGILNWLNIHFDRIGVAIAHRTGLNTQFVKLLLLYGSVIPFWVSGLVQQFLFKQKEKDRPRDYLIAIACTWFLWAIFLVKMLLILEDGTSITPTDIQMILLLSSIISAFLCVISLVIYGLLDWLFKVPRYPAYLFASFLPPMLLFGYVACKSSINMHDQQLVFYQTQADMMSMAVMSFFQLFLPVLIAVNPSRVRFIGLLLIVLFAGAYGIDFLATMVGNI